MIVIVEDYQIVAMHVRAVLERAGFKVPAAFATGEEFIEYMENSKPDLVLMDVMLDGDLDGINTVDILRKKHNLPVIFLTALSDNQATSRIRQFSNCALINKPFEDNVLVETVQRAMSNGLA
jgi:DNA-binding response OmpR family regulator